MTGIAVPEVDAPEIRSENQASILAEIKLNASARILPKDVFSDRSLLPDDPKPIVLGKGLLEFVQIANDLGSRASIDKSSFLAEDEVMKNRYRKIIVRPTRIQ